MGLWVQISYQLFICWDIGNTKNMKIDDNSSFRTAVPALRILIFVSSTASLWFPARGDSGTWRLEWYWRGSRKRRINWLAMITHASNNDLMSNKSWGLFSEGKSPAARCLGYSPCRMRLNLLVWIVEFIDSGWFWDGEGTWDWIYKTENNDWGMPDSVRWVSGSK